MKSSSEELLSSSAKKKKKKAFEVACPCKTVLFVSGSWSRHSVGFCLNYFGVYLKCNWSFSETWNLRNICEHACPQICLTHLHGHPIMLQLSFVSLISAESRKKGKKNKTLKTWPWHSSPQPWGETSTKLKVMSRQRVNIWSVMDGRFTCWINVVIIKLWRLVVYEQ